ncbi:MAG: DUF945 family protein [Thiomicrospira sp.]
MAKESLGKTRGNGWRYMLVALAALGLMYLVAVYYTAKQVESQFYALAEQAGEIPGLVLLNVSFDAGVLSSYANTKWEIDDQTVSLDHFIDNGLFQMQMLTVLSDSPLRDSLTDLLLNKQEEPVTINTEAGLFNQTIHNTFVVADLNDGEVRLAQTQGWLDLFADQQIELGLRIKRLRLVDEQGDWTLEGVDFSGQNEGQTGALAYRFSLDTLTASFADQSVLRLAGLLKTSHSVIEHNRVKTNWHLAFKDGQLKTEGTHIDALSFSADASLALANEVMTFDPMAQDNQAALNDWVLKVLAQPITLDIERMAVQFNDVAQAQSSILALDAQAQFFIPSEIMQQLTLDDLVSVALISPIRFAPYLEAALNVDMDANWLAEYGFPPTQLAPSSLSPNNRLLKLAWQDSALHLNGERLD